MNAKNAKNANKERQKRSRRRFAQTSADRKKQSLTTEARRCGEKRIGDSVRSREVGEISEDRRPRQWKHGSPDGEEIKTLVIGTIGDIEQRSPNARMHKIK